MLKRRDLVKYQAFRYVLTEEQLNREVTVLNPWDSRSRSVVIREEIGPNAYYVPEFFDRLTPNVCGLRPSNGKGFWQDLDVELIQSPFVDGKTIEQCFQIYENHMRAEIRQRVPLTPAQRAAGSSAWSAKLHELQKEARQKERMQVVVDLDYDE